MTVPQVNLASPLAQGLMALWHVDSPRHLTFPAGTPLAVEYSTVSKSAKGPIGAGALAAFGFAMSPDVPAAPPFSVLAVGTVTGSSASNIGVAGVLPSGSNGGFRSVVGPGQVPLGAFGSVSTYSFPVTSIPAFGDTFHFCVTVNRNNGSMAGYVNGSSLGTASGIGIMVAATPSPIFQVGFSSGAGTQPYLTPGAISLAALWRRELQPQEVAALYRNPGALLKSGPR